LRRFAGFGRVRNGLPQSEVAEVFLLAVGALLVGVSVDSSEVVFVVV
jgi:hypothetical protein